MTTQHPCPLAWPSGGLRRPVRLRVVELGAAAAVPVGGGVDHQQVNERWVPLLCQDPATAPHEAGALVIDDTGDADALGFVPIANRKRWRRGRRVP